MSHGSKYAVLEYQLVDPLDSLNIIKEKIVGRWGGTYSPSCR